MTGALMAPEQFSALVIGIMLIGVIFSVLYPRGDRRHDRANAVFALGAALFLWNWLINNPDQHAYFAEQIAVALLGLILLFIRRLR